MGSSSDIGVKRSALCAAVRCAVLLTCVWLSSVAAAFPDKPVHLVVPYPAGGSSDVLARVLSARLAELWDQPVVVENMPGGGSVFGTHTVSKAAPDGHTLLAGSAALAINEALSQKLPYHALRDLRSDLARGETAPGTGRALELPAHAGAAAHGCRAREAGASSRTAARGMARSATLPESSSS